MPNFRIAPPFNPSSPAEGEIRGPGGGASPGSGSGGGSRELPGGGHTCEVSVAGPATAPGRDSPHAGRWSRGALGPPERIEVFAPVARWAAFSDRSAVGVWRPFHPNVLRLQGQPDSFHPPTPGPLLVAFSLPAVRLTRVRSAPSRCYAPSLHRERTGARL